MSDIVGLPHPRSDPQYHDTQQSTQISQKEDERNIHAIMKTMCRPGYHYSGFVVTHALGHMMYGFGHII